MWGDRSDRRFFSIATRDLPAHIWRRGVGRRPGQSGASLDLPSPIAALAPQDFTHAFVDAMHPALVLPIAILVLAAGETLFVRPPRQAPLALHEEQVAVA